jgi:Ribbon-helix-helix protein, copG family
MSKKWQTETEDREKYAIWLDKEDLAELRKHQEKIGVSVSESIRRAVKAYLKKL